LITITFFLALYHGYYSKKETLFLYLLNISLAKGFSYNYFLTGIGPSWSMSVEELFYILCPVLFLYGKNIFSLIKMILLFYGLGIFITYLFSFFQNDGFFENYIFTAYHTFFGRVFEFCCGIFLGFLVKGRYPDFFMHRIGKKILHIGILIVALSVFLLYLIAKKYQILHATDVWAGLAVNNIIMPVGITFIFYSLIYHKSFFQSFLATKIMVKLGNATYSFYLLHTTFVLSYIFKFISTNVFIALITMIIVSLFFFMLVEQPCANFLKRKFYRK
jgi:peptidoglycan/LPS O-acetylase OafA/YrhL